MLYDLIVNVYFELHGKCNGHSRILIGQSSHLTF